MARISPQIGDNGRLYFNYNLGAKYLCEEVRPATAGGCVSFSRFVYAVERCEYIDGREYYRISRDGRALVSPFTVNRLHYVLHFMQVDQIAAGERQELPLTADDITTYFAAKKAYIEAQRAHALRVLGSKPEYKALTERQRRLCISIGRAEALGEAVGALNAELAAVEEEIKGIYLAAGVKPAHLSGGARACPVCGGNGLKEDGTPCGCALRIESKIKDYCARLRQSERRAECGAVRK